MAAAGSVLLLCALAQGTAAQAPGTGNAAQDAPPEPEGRYLSNPSLTLVRTDADTWTYVASGGFVVRWGDLEMRADRAVLWLDPHSLQRALQGTGPDPAADPLHQGPVVPGVSGRPVAPREIVGLDAGGAFLLDHLREIYLEGHVFVRLGTRTVLHAEQLYQHFGEDRALVRHTVLFHREDPDSLIGPVHLQLRADTIRSLGDTEILAEGVNLTTCDYGEPHYHVVAAEAHWAPENGTFDTGRVTIGGNHVRIGDVPVVPLPGFSVKVDRGQASIPLKKVRVGASNRYGTFVQTLWGDDYDELGAAAQRSLGLDAPFEGDFELAADFMSRRGVGLGPGITYGSEGLYQGEIGTYFVRDHADQDRSTLPIPERNDQEGDPFRYDITQPNRFRAFTRNRVTPVENWRIDAEVNYFSDLDMQREYFEDEAKEDKEPESYVFVVNQEGTRRLSGLYRNRLNDWDTQLDSLPSFQYDELTLPLFRLPGFDDARPSSLLLSTTTQVANLRTHPSDLLPLPSDQALRADTQVELSAPMEFGPFGFRPFAAGRATGWSESANNGDSLGRTAGSAGARVQLPFHRNYAALVPALSIDGLRHTAIFDVGYENVYAVSRDPSELIHFDETEDLVEKEFYSAGLHQRLQTWRGGQIVDFLEFDVDVPLFPDADRDNPVTTDSNGQPKGRTAGPLNYEMYYRPGFTHPWLRGTVFHVEGDWDLHEDEFRTFNAGMRVSPAPRWVTRASYRTVRGRSRVLTTGVDYQVTDKWSMGFLNQTDLRNNDLIEQRVFLRHHGHDFLFELAVDRDEGDGDTSFSIALTPILFGGDSGSRLSRERGNNVRFDDDLR